MITRKIKIETISKVKDFVNEISKVDVNADLSNPDRRYVVDAKSILGILSLDISHVMNLTIYDEEKNAGKQSSIVTIRLPYSLPKGNLEMFSP